MVAGKRLWRLTLAALFFIATGVVNAGATPFYREIFVRCGVPGNDPRALDAVAWSALAGGRTIGNPHNLRVNTPGSPNVFIAINSFPFGTTPGAAFFPLDEPDIAKDLLIYTQEISFDVAALKFVRYDQRLSGRNGSDNNGTHLAFLIGETWYISDQIFSQVQLGVWETVAVDPRSLTYGTTPFNGVVGPFRPQNSGLPLPLSGVVAGFGVFMRSVNDRVRLDNYELSDDALVEHDPGPQGSLSQCPTEEVPTPSPTLTPTDAPSPTATPSPTSTATVRITLSPTAIAREVPPITPTVSATPSSTPSATAPATSSSAPTIAPTPSATATTAGPISPQECTTVANVTNKGAVDEGAVRLAALTAEAAAFLKRNAHVHLGPARDARRAVRKAQLYVDFVQTLLIEYPEVSKVCPNTPIFCASVDRSRVLGELNSLYRKLFNSARRFTARAFFSRARSTKQTKRNKNLRLVKQAFRLGLEGINKLPKVETACQ
jgi:hypothetical protein